jgi:hypothetical protein
MLSEFRSHLVAGTTKAVLLNAVFDVAAAHHLLKAGGWQRTDSTHVLAAARAMNRIERVYETLGMRWRCWPWRRLLGCWRKPCRIGQHPMGRGETYTSSVWE